MNSKVILVLVVVVIGGMATLYVWLISVSLDDLRSAKNVEQFSRYAWRATLKGPDGVPLLLASIEDSLETPFSLFSYGKVNIALSYLHDLASEGTYTVESVPALLRIIEQQIYMPDTLVTAEILQMITGVNPGYDENFVKSYQVGDEELVHEKLDAWHRWCAANCGRDQ